MIGLKRGTVKLVPYNPEWNNLYEKEKKLLTAMLGTRIVEIQHIGSTAIPDIVAKPILDISVGIKNIDNLLLVEELSKKLESLGYEWRKQNSTPDHHIFTKGPEEKRIIYLHLVEYNGGIWNNDAIFRDFIKANRQVRLEYENLKKELAKKYANDREKYTKGKLKFIVGVLKAAKKNL